MTETNMGSGLVLGVEIGGTKLQAAVGYRDGVIESVRRGRVPEGADARKILEWFEENVPALIKETNPIAGIGVGFGGPVDQFTGAVLASHQISGWEGFELRDWFSERFGAPAEIENDANAAGWAEYRLGVGKGTDCFFYTNIGSGIGGALVFEDELYFGQGLGAAELGHTWVPDWTADAPGAAAKLEDLCSGWAIERRIRQWRDIDSSSPLHETCSGDPSRLTCADLGRAAETGDERARAEIERIGGTFGRALANVITLLHPERIAIGGGVSQMGEALLKPIREACDRHVFIPFRERYEIHQCALGDDIVVAGALLIAP